MQFCWSEPLRDARFKCKYSDGLLFEMQAFWKTVWNSAMCIDESLLVQRDAFDVFSYDKMGNLCWHSPVQEHWKMWVSKDMYAPSTASYTLTDFLLNGFFQTAAWQIWRWRDFGKTMIQIVRWHTRHILNMRSDSMLPAHLWCVINAMPFGCHRKGQIDQAGCYSVLPWYKYPITVWHCLTVFNCACAYRITSHHIIAFWWGAERIRAFLDHEVGQSQQTTTKELVEISTQRSRVWQTPGAQLKFRHRYHSNIYIDTTWYNLYNWMGTVNFVVMILVLQKCTGGFKQLPKLECSGQ